MLAACVRRTNAAEESEPPVLVAQRRLVGQRQVEPNVASSTRQVG